MMNQNTGRAKEMRKALHLLLERTNEEVMAELEERQKKELEFHDCWRDREQGHIGEGIDPSGELDFDNEKFYLTTGLSRQHLLQYIEQESKGEIFLDYACGDGQNTLLAAKAGAELAIGIDLSCISIQNARKAAMDQGLTNTLFLQADCENTGFPDLSVGRIVCSGMLHHLDLTKAFPEMKRILQPGGSVYCIEALNYNPFTKLYRKLTPALRTDFEAEHILSMKEVRFAKTFFALEEIRFWHLFSIGAAFLRKTFLFKPALALGDLIDRVLLSIYPISLMAWQFSFILRKPKQP